jgi:hypothetical protein
MARPLSVHSWLGKTVHAYLGLAVGHRALDDLYGALNGLLVGNAEGFLSRSSSAFFSASASASGY